jgi:protein-L-isoaspartate(D-aspartate) O-methyltransferase
MGAIASTASQAISRASNRFALEDFRMADLAAARLNMVESQVRTNDVTDIRIQDAMRALPRETFMPAAKAYLAYADIEVEHAPGRWLLKPRDIGKLLQALRPMPGERALAVAAPYAAAVLERMGLAVTRHDGSDLQPPPAGQPYDLVICEGAVGRAPASWLAALALHGRLGVVERDGAVGKACIYINAEDGVGRREVFDSFAPVLSGLELQHGFAF